MSRPRLHRPVPGCQATVSGYHSVARHTMPAHNLWAECAVGRKTQCRCAQKRSTDQDNSGDYAMVVLTNGKSLIIEGLSGLEEGANFLSGQRMARGTSTLWTTQIIRRHVLRRMQPLTYNLTTGLLEKKMDPEKGKAVAAMQVNPPGEGQLPNGMSL